MSFNKKDKIEMERISTGSLGLDIATGGGWPRGRIIELYGPNSSGKSTLCLHALAEVNKNGGIGAYIDAENAFDPVYAKALGVDIYNSDLFAISQPDNGEQALDIARTLIKTKELDLIVIDSVAALTPKAEIEGDIGDQKLGLQARLMSQSLRMMTAEIKRSNTVVIFINQLREKIGVIYGSPEVTSGGNALKFYASIRADIRKIGLEKSSSNEITANKTRVKIVKNKTFPPFKQAEFNIEYGVGIDRVAELIDWGVELGIISKSGSWYNYGDTKLAQGTAKVKDVFLDNPELFNEIEKKIYEELEKEV
jgi:recombination protein RecA